ncbi:MAG: hypothetical protein HUU29_11370 [Planctomycetaceae bacterium]|nr:hypothetical protein [Planctomycetaceae bacterium]
MKNMLWLVGLVGFLALGSTSSAAGTEEVKQPAPALVAQFDAAKELEAFPEDVESIVIDDYTRWGYLDYGDKTLAPLPRFKKLKSLEIQRFSYLTDEGVKHIVAHPDSCTLSGYDTSPLELYSPLR